MDHEGATQTQAVERYILGDMPAEERDAFEEHYFTCGTCAEEVRAAARFRANAREVLRHPESLEPKRRFAWWSYPQLLPLGAALLLACVVVYQRAVEIPALRQQPVAVAAVPFSLPGITREAEGRIRVIPAGIPMVALVLDLPTDAHADAYECTIKDASNRTVATPVVRAGPRTESVTILLNRSRLGPGKYTIMVRGGPAAAGAPQGHDKVISQYQFMLE
jgi:hypothetical protein